MATASDGAAPAPGPTAMPGPPPMDPAVFALLAAEYRGDRVIAAAITTLVFGIAFVSMRFYTRLCIVRKASSDDWLILVALVFSFATSAGMIAQATKGNLGRHFMTTPPERMRATGIHFYWTNLVYISGLVSCKLSILLLYLRILSTTFTHRVCYVAIGIVVAVGLYSLGTAIFICVPVGAFWDILNYPTVWCFPWEKAWSDIALHIFTEFMILVLPMPFLARLRMRLGVKIPVCLLFATGLFLIFVSFFRIPSIKASIESATTMTGDPSWAGVPAAIWSLVELNVAIACACAMTLRPLAGRLFPRLISSGYNRESGDNVIGARRHPRTVGSQRNMQRRPRDVTLDSLDGAPPIPRSTTHSDVSQSTAVKSEGSIPRPYDKEDVESGQFILMRPE